MNVISRWVIVCATMWLLPAAADSIWLPDARLAPGEGDDGGNFGEVAAMFGDTVLLGAPGAAVGGNFSQGAVYAFERQSEQWSEPLVLIAADGAVADQFGRALAITADMVVIGAPYANVDGNNNQGAVYVFTRDAAGWSQHAKLTASDGAASDGFGHALAVTEDTIFVGAATTNVDGNNNQGAVYVFVRDGDDWSEQDRLIAGDGATGDQFGIALALSGDTLLVGAQYVNVGDNLSQGAAYVFTRDGADWLEQDRLTVADGAAFDNFGRTVAVSGDTAIFGVRAADVNGHSSQGVAYIFTRESGNWTEQARLTAEYGEAHDAFGTAVAIAGDMLWVGAPGTRVGGEHASGAAYLFARDSEGWRQQSRFADEQARNFGAAVALAGDFAVVGAPGGIPAPGVTFPPAAFVFHHLELPPDLVAVEGLVSSLGYCGDEVVPAPNATVEIQGMENIYTLQTDNAGGYQAVLPAEESPLTISVEVPDHLPLVIENVVLEGGEAGRADLALVLDAPCASTDPGVLTVAMPTGSVEIFEITVGNFDGGAVLDWAVSAAVSPFSVAGAAPPVDCDGELGLISHDDGVVNNGYTSGNPEIDQVIFVDRFTPASYPAAFRAVCIAFLSLGPTELDFEVVVFAADGGQGGQVGSPGTELGALAVTAEDIPVVTVPLPPDLEPAWFTFDLSALDLIIESGSVFIGARWAPVAPDQPDVMIAADEEFPGPNLGGGWWWNNLNEWVPMGVPSSFRPYRSLFVRAIENLGGCHEAGELPWLNVVPASGAAPADGGDAVQLEVNTGELAPGQYSASLCVTTSDPRKPLIVVPLALTVGLPDAIFRDRFEAYESSQ